MAVWSEGCYLNNFVQGVLDTFPQEELKGSTIIVSGDGRYEHSPTTAAAYNVTSCSFVCTIVPGILFVSVLSSGTGAHDTTIGIMIRTSERNLTE